MTDKPKLYALRDTVTGKLISINPEGTEFYLGNIPFIIEYDKHPEHIADLWRLDADNEIEDCSSEWVEVVVLTRDELEQKERDAFEAGRDHVSIHGILRYNEYEQYKQSKQ